jgi:hypothetical protein
MHLIINPPNYSIKELVELPPDNKLQDKRDAVKENKHHQELRNSIESTGFESIDAIFLSKFEVNLNFEFVRIVSNRSSSDYRFAKDIELERSIVLVGV